MRTDAHRGYKKAINEINDFIGQIDCENSLKTKSNKFISEIIDTIRNKLILMDSESNSGLNDTTKHALQLQGKIEMLMHARIAIEAALETDEPLQEFSEWLDVYDDICFKCVHKNNSDTADPCITCFKYKYGELTADNYSNQETDNE